MKIVTLSLAMLISCYSALCIGAISQFDSSKELALNIVIDTSKTSKQNQQIRLIATLKNLTNQTLKYTISKSPHPLTHSIWDHNGFNLSLKHRKRAIKNGNSQTEELTLALNQTKVFERNIDLTKYKQAIAADNSVIIKATFYLFKSSAKTLQFTRVKAPPILYKTTKKGS